MSPAIGAFLDGSRSFHDFHRDIEIMGACLCCDGESYEVGGLHESLLADGKPG